MPSDECDIRTTLERALENVDSQRGDSFTARIRPIVFKNFTDGRLDFFLANTPNAIPHHYVWLVVNKYEQLKPYIQRVQLERNSTEWGALYTRLQKWSYSFLKKNGLYPCEGTSRMAVDCATDAAITLLQAHFPYDTDFDPWAYNFVKYTCLKSIQKAAQQTKYIQENIFQEGLLEPQSDPKANRKKWALYLDVINALMSLTENRRQVLVLRYECGLSSKEIAFRMGKSVSAVDKLHFDAIKQLRQLLHIDVDV